MIQVSMSTSTTTIDTRGLTLIRVSRVLADSLTGQYNGEEANRDTKRV